MMKHSIVYAALIAAAGAGVMAGCTDDVVYNLGDGTGNVTLQASLATDVTIATRADADALRADYGTSLTLWLTRIGQGPVRQYEGIDNIPSGNIALATGSYAAEAWAGDSLPASFEHKYFKGYTPFTVSSGATTPVEVKCRIANAIVSFTFGDNLEEVIRPDWTITVGHARGTLQYTGRDTRKGYFMMPSSDKDLTVTLEATTIFDTPYTQTYTIADAAPATEYIVDVRYNGRTAEGVGGQMLDISVDATEVAVDDEVTLTLAPEIVGVGFDISQPQNAQPGALSQLSVYVAAVDRLDDLVMESTLLTPIISADRIGLTACADEALQMLLTGGIKVQRLYLDSADDSKLTNIRVDLLSELTETLAEGTYSVKFTAKEGTRSATQTLTIKVTQAPLTLLPVDAPGVVSVTLTANVLDDNVGTDAGFYYSRAGLNEWTFVPGVLSRAGTMTALVEGLTSDTAYEYYASTGGFQTEPMTFTTALGPQLPNSGFEEWSTSGSLVNPFLSADLRFWDTGNTGANTLGGNLTTSDTSVKHSGRYSAKLESQFVGFMSIGKFAAGNIFVGQYLKTDGTDGVLGWGRPIDFQGLKPRAIKGYVRYEPAAISHTSAECPDAVSGQPDQGIIYCALLDGTTGDDARGEYPEWPVVIRTKAADRQLFSRDDPNVVSYGEMLFTTATAGMIPFYIELEDVNATLEHVNIVLTCSASRYGDYFAGGNGSTMWVDDITLVY